MTFPVNLSLLRNVSHMPALPLLERSMNRTDLTLHDFCIPINPYFPNQELVSDLQMRLSDILRFVYCQVDASVPGRRLRDILLQRTGCFVRECGSKTGSGPQFLRIATRPPDEQQLLMRALRNAFRWSRE